MQNMVAVISQRMAHALLQPDLRVNANAAHCWRTARVRSTRRGIKNLDFRLLREEND